MVIVMIRTFAACLVVLSSFIIVFGLVEAVVILDLFPARSLALVPITSLTRGKDDPPEAWAAGLWPRVRSCAASDSVRGRDSDSEADVGFQPGSDIARPPLIWHFALGD
jgi:hypothetical protein